ncbi:MAG: hypothetical protein HC884_16080 [Chloroflexaceae bacterium]|nr:hypothetical protein [Chloroflexaceae bacterium]
MGNRTGLWENGQLVASHTYNAANQVVGWQYDANGNLLDDGSRSFHYDAADRLVQHDGTSYAYNGNGVLLQATRDGTTTRYTQDLAAPLSRRVLQATAGVSTTHSLYGVARLAAQEGAGPSTWEVADVLGSVRLRVDEAGVPSAPLSYTPFGVPTAETPDPFSFTGELHVQGLV